MDTRKIWKELSKEQRAALAKGADSSPEYVYLIFYGHKKPSAALAAKIERSAAQMGIDIPRQHWLPGVFL